MLALRVLKTSSSLNTLVRVGASSDLRRFSATAVETERKDEIPTLFNGPKITLTNAILGTHFRLQSLHKINSKQSHLSQFSKFFLFSSFAGCKDAIINRYKAWKLERDGKARKLTGPEQRFVIQAKHDFGKLKPIGLILILPFVGYLAPLYFLVFPQRAPSTMITPEMKVCFSSLTETVRLCLNEFDLFLFH